jgi:thioredoxin-like negative regulator of GroEL
MATSYKTSTKGAAKKGSAKKAGARAAATSGAVPPYGEAIRQATARGDEAEMRKAAASARKWIKDAQAALEKLEKRLGKTGGTR